MKPYNTDAKCPKCGCDNINSSYLSRRDYIRLHDQDQEEKEHIRRRCQRCHYEWNEAPLDCGEKG